jgi:5,10-methylenetetrahydromethanopterin reductase
MFKIGLQIIPHMPLGELLDTIVKAEELGYERCLVADEGFMPDVYVALAAAAERTSKIHLGPVTNGYTRHPAVTAAALASLNDLSDGRAFVTLVAGGSMVLNPMGIDRDIPLTIVRETIEIMRRLWTGETVNWQGQRYRLNSARITLGKHDIPIWIAARGPKMLQLTGEMADGAMLMYKSDLGAALDLLESGSLRRNNSFQRAYLDRIAYNDDLLRQASVIWSFVILDTPARQLASMNITKEKVEEIRQAMNQGGPAEAAKLVTEDMIKSLQIAGSPKECSQIARQLLGDNKMDYFMLNLTSGGYEQNTDLMKDTLSILGKEVAVE